LATDFPIGAFSRCQGADLDQVVRQDPVADPDLGAFSAGDAGAVPAVSTFEGADSAFDSVAPLDCSSEHWAVFLGSPASRGFAIARDRHVAHAEVEEVVLDGFSP